MQRMVLRKTRDAQQRGDDRNLRLLGEFSKFVERARDDYAVTGKEHRALGCIDEVDCGIDLGVRCRRRNFVAGQLYLAVALEVVRTLFLHDIFGDVDEDRARSTCASDMERFMDRWSNVFDAGDQIVVFGDGERRTGDVGFLESVSSDRGASDLPGDSHDWDRIHHRGGQTSDQVCGTWSGGGDRNADLAGCACVTIGSVSGALLVSYKHVTQLRIPAEHSVERQNRAAGEAKHDVDALVQQRFADYVAACQFFAHVTSCIYKRTVRCANPLYSRFSAQRLVKLKNPRPTTLRTRITRGTTLLGCLSSVPLDSQPA